MSEQNPGKSYQLNIGRGARAKKNVDSVFTDTGSFVVDNELKLKSGGLFSKRNTPESGTATREVLGIDSDEELVHSLRTLRRVGEGSTGVVWKVEDSRFKGRLYALKELNLAFVPKSMYKRVGKEIRELIHCKHEKVVAFHNAYYHDERIGILLEFMNRGTLKDLIVRNGKLPELVISAIAAQLVPGLLYLHTERKLVHRDIKPSNILLDSKGNCKLGDLGMSESVMTHQEISIYGGSAVYMSPERIRCESYTRNSDVWSLGLVLLECALGKYPYELEQGHSYFDLIRSITSGENLMSPPEEMSADFIDFVNQCMEMDPKKRWSIDDENLLAHPFLHAYQRQTQNPQPEATSAATTEGVEELSSSMSSIEISNSPEKVVADWMLEVDPEGPFGDAEYEAMADEDESMRCTEVHVTQPS